MPFSIQYVERNRFGNREEKDRMIKVRKDQADSARAYLESLGKQGKDKDDRD